MRFFRLKIGQRLALSYGAVILLLIATTFEGIDKLQTLSQTTDDALKDKYPKTILVNQVIADLGIIARSMRNAMILTDPDELHLQLTDISSASNKMAAVLADLEKRINDPKGKDLLKQIRIVHSAYIVNQDDFIGRGRLRQNTLQRTFDIPRMVVQRNDHGNGHVRSRSRGRSRRFAKFKD